MADEVKDDKQIEVEMSMPMLMALDYVLGAQEVKGRSEMRAHKSVMNQLLAQCSKKLENDTNMLKPGGLKMLVEDWDTVEEFCSTAIKNGFPSRFNSGMVDLDMKLQEITKIK